MEYTDTGDMAIVVICFDGYSDLWEDFVTLINKYWTERPYKVYMVNNTKEKQYENITVINAGNEAEWSKKVQVALENIKEKYICLLLEDFFIGDYIDTKDIEGIMNFINERSIKYYKLTEMSKFAKDKAPNYKKIDHLRVIRSNDDYPVSLQAAIWDRNLLKTIVGNENYNAWIFELEQVYKKIKKIPFDKCIYDNRNILNIKHGVVQGLLLPYTVEYFRERGYSLNSNRKIMKKRKFIVYVIKSKVKHMLPKNLRRPVKKILSSFGMKFVSEK